MKFIHLSDLHLGKRLNEYSLLEDQDYILKEILKIIDEEKPDGVIIAGDIYDKSVPPVNAVELFDDFVYEISNRKIKTYIISGNHDSAERVSCGGRLMKRSGVYIAPAYDNNVEPITVQDEYGKINIYLLPFIKPLNIHKFHEDAVTYTDAMKKAIEDMHVDTKERNILVTHQFVTGAKLSDSEDIIVGGTDNIDADVFDSFDYVALGHIHSPQNVSGRRIRYCGTPLKYSFSEASHEKSVTVLEMKEKGNFDVREIPLKPLRDMVVLRGKYAELMDRKFYENTTYGEDYVHIILTDEEEKINAHANLLTVYHNIMLLSYDNKRTRAKVIIEADNEAEKKSELQLFSEFFESQNDQPMSEEQRDFMQSLINEIWGYGE